MKTKKVLKRLGDADRALGKLANLTAKACLIAKLLYDLY
jgi:hypothetical protein